MDHGQRLARRYFRTQRQQPVDTDRMVDRTLGPAVSAAERHHLNTEVAGSNLGDEAPCRRQHRMFNRRLRQVGLHLLDEIRRPAKRRHHPSEHRRGAAAVQRIDGSPGGVLMGLRQIRRLQHFGGQRQRHRFEARIARNLRQRFTVLRRDVVKMIAAGVEAGIAIDWSALHAKYQAIVACVPRTPTAEALDPIVLELQDLADYILGVLDSNLSEPAPAPAAPADVHADASASPRLLTLRPAPSTDPVRDSRADRRETVPLRVVLDACPDIIDYARGEIRSYRELLTTAALVRPLLGISPSAWEEAGQIMGELQASIVVAAILQRGIAIKNPGGYLRNLTRRAGAGQFSVWPMLMALSAARLKKAT